MPEKVESEAAPRALFLLSFLFIYFYIFTPLCANFSRDLQQHFSLLKKF